MLMIQITGKPHEEIEDKECQVPPPYKVWNKHVYSTYKGDEYYNQTYASKTTESK